MLSCLSPYLSARDQGLSGAEMTDASGQRNTKTDGMTIYCNVFRFLGDWHFPLVCVKRPTVKRR